MDGSSLGSGRKKEIRKVTLNSNDFPPEFRSEKEVIAVDFDGVVHNDFLGYHDGSIYGPVMKDSEIYLKALSANYSVVIHTAKARSDRPLINNKDGKTLVRDWLREHDLLQFVTEITAVKPRAILYIDDKAIRFQTWQKTELELRDLGII